MDLEDRIRKVEELANAGNPKGSNILIREIFEEPKDISPEKEATLLVMISQNFFKMGKLELAKRSLRMVLKMNVSNEISDIASAMLREYQKPELNPVVSRVGTL